METFRCLLLSTLLLSVSSCSWVMKLTHTNVIPNLTDDVNLRCFCENPYDSNPTIEQITRIRLLKMDNADAWSTYAEVVVPHVLKAELAKPNASDVRGSGRLGKLSQSFLSVTWSTASDDTVGTYKCEVDGFAGHQHQETSTQINTAMVNITNNAVTTTDLLDVAIQMKKKANAVSEELKTLTELILVQHQELSFTIMNRVQSSIEDNYFEQRYWPTDSFSLLSPATGCPDTPYSKMISGYSKIEVESSKTQSHNLSSPNHLHLDTMESCGSRYDLHFRFCKNPALAGRHVPWPKGTYCIHRVDDCPKDFLTGHVVLHLTSLSKAQEENIGNTYNYDLKQNILYVHFCCRNDGDVEVPILLPNQKPFYLHRYKGKCQRVFKTNVTEEWVSIDTNDAKTDTYGNNFYPDSELNDARFHLCFYQHS